MNSGYTYFDGYRTSPYGRAQAVPLLAVYRTFLGELALRLESDGVGLLNTSIFLSARAKLPPGGGPFLTLIETGGVGPLFTHNEIGSAKLRPGAQVVVRGGSYVATRLMADQAYASLDGVFNTLIGTSWYQSLTARQEPTDIGLDDFGRVRVSFNLDAVRTV